MEWEPTKYRIYLSDGNRLVVKAEKNFLENVQDHKRFFSVGGYLVNTNQITFIEKLGA